MTWITPLNLPIWMDLWDPLPMPATFSVPAGCLNASEEFTKWAANYGMIAAVMWTSSSPKGQSSQCSIQKSRVFQPSLSWCQRTQGICVLSYISTTWTAIWSFRSSRWKPRHQSGHPSERANGLCPSTYRTHICMFPWQGLHGNTSGSWSTVKFTSLAWLFPLGNLPRWPGGSKGLSSMFTWTVGLSSPPPLYRPELMPIWSCKCCSTYAGWSISVSLICHPASNSISSACNSVCVLTSWHPCPNWGSKSRTCWITGDRTLVSPPGISRDFSACWPLWPP